MHIFILKLLLNLRIIVGCRIGERTMSFSEAETISKGSGLPGRVAFPSCASRSRAMVVDSECSGGRTRTIQISYSMQFILPSNYTISSDNL